MSIFTPDTSTIKDFYQRGLYLLAWRVCLAFTVVFIFLGGVYSVTNASGIIPVIAVLSVTFFGFYYLKKTKNTRIVFWIFAIGGSLISGVAMSTMNEYTHYVDFLWLTCCILIAFIGLGSKEGLIFIFLNSISIFIFFFFALNNHIEVLSHRTVIENIGDFVEVLFAFFIIAYLLHQFVKMQRHAENKLIATNKSLEIQNKLNQTKSLENETLLKEIHHRVKNNLQIIISLLRMQSQDMKTEEGKEHFKEAINRIMTMSLIHEKLYAEKELSKINLQSYIEELTLEIVNAFTIADKDIKLFIKTDVKQINLNTIVPLGLLINELVSNSIKHGLKGVEHGEIRINISRKDNQYQFSYYDNGTWKEAAADKSSFGVELIDILTEQMNGEKSLDITNGTCYLFLLNDV